MASLLFVFHPFAAFPFAAFPFAPPVPVLAAALVASIWQGLLLTLMAALGLRLLPGLSADAKAWVWVAVLLLVALLPIASLSYPRPGGAGHPAAVHLAESVSLALVAIWAAASALRLMQLLGSALRLRGMLTRATPLQPSETIAPLLRGGRRPVELCSSKDVDRPSVAGFLRPRILLPPDLVLALSEADLRHIILHEREHLRRGDDWLNLLQQLSLMLFPLNPALLWLNRRLALERELACDEGVLRSTRARKAYAACLARVAEISLVQRGVSLALGILGEWRRRPELARRVEHILNAPKQGMGRTQMRVAASLVVAGVLGSSALLTHSPELVSFVPANTLSYGAGDTSVAAGPAMQSGWPAGSATGPRPTLVKAVLPAHPMLLKAIVPTNGPSAQPLTVQPLTKGRTPRHPLMKAAARNHLRTRTSPWVLLTDWRQPQTAASARGTASLRLLPVMIEEQQILYTAVPWQGGWLVVQL